MQSQHTSLELKVTILVHHPLGQVDIPGIPVTVYVGQITPQNGNVAAALDGKVDVRGALAEVLAVPLEVAYMR